MKIIALEGINLRVKFLISDSGGDSMLARGYIFAGDSIAIVFLYFFRPFRVSKFYAFPVVGSNYYLTAY